MDYSSPGSSVHRLFWGRILEWVAIFFLQGIFPDPGIEPMSSALAGEVFLFFFPLPTEPPEKPCFSSSFKFLQIRRPYGLSFPGLPFFKNKDFFLWAGYEQEFLNLPPELEGYYVEWLQ